MYATHLSIRCKSKQKQKEQEKVQKKRKHLRKINFSMNLLQQQQERWKNLSLVPPPPSSSRCRRSSTISSSRRTYMFSLLCFAGIVSCATNYYVFYDYENNHIHAYKNEINGNSGGNSINRNNENSKIIIQKNKIDNDNNINNNNNNINNNNVVYHPSSRRITSKNIATAMKRSSSSSSLLSSASSLHSSTSKHDEHNNNDINIHYKNDTNSNKIIPLRYLSFGSVENNFDGGDDDLHNPIEESYSYLLSSDVNNVAASTSLSMCAICTQSIIQDRMYDVITIDFFDTDGGLYQLSKRIRQRFPNAIIVFVQLWTPDHIYYYDNHNNVSIPATYMHSYMTGEASIKAATTTTTQNDGNNNHDDGIIKRNRESFRKAAAAITTTTKGTTTNDVGDNVGDNDNDITKRSGKNNNAKSYWHFQNLSRQQKIVEHCVEEFDGYLYSLPFNTPSSLPFVPRDNDNKSIHHSKSNKIGENIDTNHNKNNNDGAMTLITSSIYLELFQFDSSLKRSRNNNSKENNGDVISTTTTPPRITKYLSKKGHQVVANGIYNTIIKNHPNTKKLSLQHHQKIISSQKISSSLLKNNNVNDAKKGDDNGISSSSINNYFDRDLVGSWYPGDYCSMWYTTGDYNAVHTVDTDTFDVTTTNDTTTALNNTHSTPTTTAATSTNGYFSSKKKKNKRRWGQSIYDFFSRFFSYTINESNKNGSILHTLRRVKVIQFESHQQQRIGKNDDRETKKTIKHALEMSRKGGSIYVHNPFQESRILYLTYMTSFSDNAYYDDIDSNNSAELGGDSNFKKANQLRNRYSNNRNSFLSLMVTKNKKIKVYPRTKVIIDGKSVLILDPVHDGYNKNGIHNNNDDDTKEVATTGQQQNHQHHIHLTRTTAVGHIPPGNALLEFKTLNYEPSSEYRFRLVGYSVLKDDIVDGIPFEYDIQPEPTIVIPKPEKKNSILFFDGDGSSSNNNNNNNNGGFFTTSAAVPSKNTVTSFRDNDININYDDKTSNNGKNNDKEENRKTKAATTTESRSSSLVLSFFVAFFRILRQVSFWLTWLLHSIIFSVDSFIFDYF